MYIFWLCKWGHYIISSLTILYIHVPCCCCGTGALKERHSLTTGTILLNKGPGLSPTDTSALPVNARTSELS